MRTTAGRPRNAMPAPRPRPAAPAAQDRGPGPEPIGAVLQGALAQLASPPRESAALVGLTGGRIDAVQLVDLAEGEPPALSTVQALLRDSEAVAMVVFTDHLPPQWVAQPCCLLREVLVVSTTAAPAHRHGGPSSGAEGGTDCDDNRAAVHLCRGQDEPCPAHRRATSPHQLSRVRRWPVGATGQTARQRF